MLSLGLGNFGLEKKSHYQSQKFGLEKSLSLKSFGLENNLNFVLDENYGLVT